MRDLKNLRSISEFNSLTLDTNVFIYHLDSRSPFHTQASQLFEIIAQEKIKISTSNTTLIEALSYQAPKKQIKILQDELFNIPNLEITEMNNDIAIEAARIRRENGFSLPDSIQLATARINKAQAFVSNDERLKYFKEIKIILLQTI